MVSWASAGNVGFKGSRKSTPFAAQQAAEEAEQTAAEEGGARLRAVRRAQPQDGHDASVREEKECGGGGDGGGAQGHRKGEAAAEEGGEGWRASS